MESSSSSSSKEVAKRSASSALMPPPGDAPKRIKRPAIVLEDDEYTEKLSDIIKRRFYPGLHQDQAKIEYFDALQSGDQTWIREAGKALEAAMENPEPSMSLDAFFQKYTSEDNESVYQLLDKANKERWEKQGWTRSGNKYASKQRIAQEKVLAEKRARERGIEGTEEGEDSGSAKGKELAVVARPSQDLDARPAAPDTAQEPAYNSLMFVPEGIEDHLKSRHQLAEAASLAPPKAILYNNTRFPAPSAASDTPPDPPSPTLTAVKDAIAGRPRPTASESGFGGSETPRVNGYAFVETHVPDEPLNPPSSSKTDLLERYGMKSDGSSTPNPFRIPEGQRREKLAHKMVERIQADKSRKREEVAMDSGNKTARRGRELGIFKGMETPRFGFTPGARTVGGKKDVASMTPAARRLFDSVGGKTPVRGMTRGFGGGDGEMDWTPKARKKG